MSEPMRMMTEDNSDPGVPPAREPRGLASLVGAVAHAMGGVLSAGDVAELRRLSPSNPVSPAFFKLMTSIVDPGGALPADGPPRDVIDRRWSVVVQAAATLQGLHGPQRRLGSALAAAGFSELRFVRLLRSRDDGLHHEVRVAAQYLAAKGEACDLADIAGLVLVADPDRADSLRRSIARSYFRTLSHQEKEP